jgi:chromosome segregation ATPase
LGAGIWRIPIQIGLSAGLYLDGTMSLVKGMIGAAIVALLVAGIVPHVLAQEGNGSSEEPTLSPGLDLTSELRAIIEEHKEAVRSIILEFKLKLENITARRIELINQFLEERLNRTETIRNEMERLRELYRSGNMTKEEYLVALKKLKDELKALSKTSEKLGQLMQELTKELKEAVKEKVERLREVNREFGQRVSEEARRIGEEMRERARERGQTTTTTEQTDQTTNQTQTGHRGRGRGNTESESTNTERGRGQGRGQGQHEETTTTTTASERHERGGRHSSETTTPLQLSRVGSAVEGMDAATTIEQRGSSS